MDTMKGKRGRKSRKPCEKNAMKVVYISTPLKVKTTASKFREIVQELTGRGSDVVRIMENFDFNNNFNVINNINNTNYNMVFHDNYNYNINNDYNYNYIIGDSSDGLEEGLIETRDDDNRTVPIGGVFDDKTSFSISSDESVDHQFESSVYFKEEEGFGQFDSSTLLYDPIYNQIDVLGSY